MRSTLNILYGLPFFRHLTRDEIDGLVRSGRTVYISKGKKLELKKINSFNIVISGLFEIESLGKNDMVYLSPGSFFGDTPFAVNRQQGFISACVDSELFILDTDDMYRFFLSSVKAARGYLKALGIVGLDLSDTGKIYSSRSSKYISIASPYENSGKTLLSATVALACARIDKTIILDMSYEGKSIFDLFEMEVNIAISQRQSDETSTEKLINERIKPVTENLSLLNISFGAKVKVNPEIISPVLFILSKQYKFIIMDLSGHDPQLRNRVLGLSDEIFFLIKKPRDMELVHDLLDRELREGQRTVFVLNRYFAPSTHTFEGGILFENLDWVRQTRFWSALNESIDKINMNDFMRFISRRKKALVLESHSFNAIAFAGFLSALNDTDNEFDIIYASFLSYFILSLTLLAEDDYELEKFLVRTFSDDKLNSLLDITFPKEHVIKNNRIMKLTKELCAGGRIESFKNLPVLRCMDEDTRKYRLFSTGDFHKLMTVSFALYPLFEPVGISGAFYHSGFPVSRVMPEDLHRSDINDMLYITVENKQEPDYKETNLLGFYRNSIEFISDLSIERGFHNTLYRTIELEIDEKEMKKIYYQSRNKSNKLLKEMGF